MKDPERQYVKAAPKTPKAPQEKKRANVDAIPYVEWVDKAGTVYYLEEVKKGEYVLRPRPGAVT